MNSNKTSFLAAYENYIIYAKRKLKSQSIQSLLGDFKNHILPFFKDYYLEDITSSDILKWQDNILSLNRSNNFNKKVYYHLSGFFTYCKVFYKFDKTILSNIGCFKKKYEKDKHDYYTLKEFNRFIKCVDNIIYKNFFNFMFFTGTRPGEAMALKFSDIKHNYIVIDKTMESHKKREIGTPKTGSSYRDIYLDNKLLRDLKTLHKYYIDLYGIDNDYYIFGGKKPLSPSTINRYKMKACKKANIRPITLQQFRHSHASLLYDKKVNIIDISKRLGHSRVSTTMDIYTHTSLDQEKRVLDTLNSARYNFFERIAYLPKRIISVFIKTFKF